MTFRFLLQFLLKTLDTYKINEICIHSAHYFSIIIYWLEISFWCTSRKAAFEWFIPDLVASMHKIFVIEMDMAKRLASKGAVVANQYKPCCHQQFFLEKNIDCKFCLNCFFTFIKNRLLSKLRELIIQLCWDGHIFAQSYKIIWSYFVLCIKFHVCKIYVMKMSKIVPKVR